MIPEHAEQERYNQIDQLFQPELAASRAARDSRGNPVAIEAQGLFAERNAFFKRMEDGDEEALTLWKRFQICEHRALHQAGRAFEC
jgi:hypothetical protein